jgi:hypothetical protein
LAAAAALMPVKVSQERDREEERRRTVLPKDVKPLTPIDLATNEQVLARVSQPKRVVLAGEHNVFNPVRWQKRPDGSIYRAQEAGTGALQIMDIRPLHLRLEFDQVVPGATQAEVRYRVIYLNEAQRSGRPQPRDAVAGEKYNIFTVEKVIGEDKTNPEALQILLPGEKQPVQISKKQPYERVIGYEADVKHAPAGVEDKVWKEVRVKDELTFGGETYNIVAITANEVVLSAKSNKKQTVLEFKGTAK